MLCSRFLKADSEYPAPGLARLRDHGLALLLGCRDECLGGLARIAEDRVGAQLGGVGALLVERLGLCRELTGPSLGLRDEFVCRLVGNL